MAKRSGIAASTVSAVIFSTLLISGVAVSVASQGRATLYSKAEESDSLYDSFEVISAAEGANVLIGAQSLLQGSAFGCPTAIHSIAEGVDRLSQVESEGNLTVGAVASYLQAGSEPDNMSALSPFAGAAPGDLDIALGLTGSGEASGVALHKTETHFVHLGLHLQAAVTDCEASATSISASLSGLDPGNCTTSALAPAIDSAAQIQASLASADGFSFGFTYAVEGSPSCMVHIFITLVQAGIPGMAGKFSVIFHEAESVSLPGPSSSPPAGRHLRTAP
jgi:hypothetical protein